MVLMLTSLPCVRNSESESASHWQLVRLTGNCTLAFGHYKYILPTTLNVSPNRTSHPTKIDILVTDKSVEYQREKGT
jgi:hypothetical protein